MAIKDRLTMSDVYNNTTPVIGKKVPFSEAYPEIENITVEVEKDGKGVREWNKHSVFKKDFFTQFIDCNNSLCVRGGFALGEMLREMLRDKKTVAEKEKVCMGNEGSPKGRRIYRSCINTFKVKISIKYK